MQTETYYLEEVVSKVTGQRTVPIGDAILSTIDTAIGCETCEELFTPRNPSTVIAQFWGTENVLTEYSTCH